MNNKLLKKEGKKNDFIKYLIFNFILMCSFFFFVMGTNNSVSAVESFTLYQSNHNGNSNNKNAVIIETTDGEGNPLYSSSGQYIQTTGRSLKDTVSFRIVIETTQVKKGIVAFESGYTGSSEGANYDLYVKNDYNVWNSIIGTGLAKGKVLANNNNFTTTAASSSELVANGATDDNAFYSFVYIGETVTRDEGTNEIIGYTYTIDYVYTIRSYGFGYKSITFALYNDDPYDEETGAIMDPDTVESRTIQFITSKPVDEFEYHWVGEEDTDTDTTPCGNYTLYGGDDIHDDITLQKLCIKYMNRETVGNGVTTADIIIPKESAYRHSPATSDAHAVSDITSSTIYASNTFVNVGSGGSAHVKYYYWDFVLENGNSTINPEEEYEISLEIDASGNYIFVIKDIFGNIFTSPQVDVDDVSITNIIVDYTTAHNLTIMNATGEYISGNWKNNWGYSINDVGIDFTKMAKEKVTIEVHVFQRIVINNGVYAEGETNVEPIAKQPLGYEDGDVLTNPNQYTDTGVKIWRIKKPKQPEKPDDDDGTEGKGIETKICNLNGFTCSFAEGGANSSGNLRKNKITFDVTDNGIYRIMITDNYNNTTNSLDGNDKNPKIEISVIDRTTPIITSVLGGNTDSNASTSINSYDYVIGGGQINPSIPTSLVGEYWNDVAGYSTIYYNAKGRKIFTYKDALKIANIKVVDNVLYYNGDADGVNKLFSGYNINFGYSASTCANFNASPISESNINAGVYCDPSDILKSDRNELVGTDYNLHNYIISNNITSFTGGIVKQVGSTTYDSDTANDYIKIDSDYYLNNDYDTISNIKFVNGTTDFLGYLKIEFKSELDVTLCTLNSSDDDNANIDCFTEINKLIDDVANFKMIFSTVDYLENVSNSYVVTVNVIDTTSPGIDKTGGEGDGERIDYTNEVNECRLEIDNAIQFKSTILECYKIKDGTTYYVKDNNLITTEGQYYDLGTTGYNYDNKIALSVWEDGGLTAEWIDVTDSTIETNLIRAGHHKLKIIISDHWKDLTGPENDDINSNTLTIYLNYYVNPRTLLVEPLKDAKMYGQDDPIFDYCIHVNKNNSTFNLSSHFFDMVFIDSYFNYIYCTKDMYIEIQSSNRYTRSEIQAATASNPYPHYTYSQDNHGDYLKVNNTYVKIIETDNVATNRYNRSTSTQNDSGDYLFKNSNYYKLEEGYKYADPLCTLAYVGVGDLYLKIGENDCEKVENANRYIETFAKSTSGAYLKYNTGLASESLVQKEGFSISFNGKLARVESSCYNGFGINNIAQGDDSFETALGCSENILDSQNNNVGEYHIVLGTLSTTDYNDDYVIKLNTKYFATTTLLDTSNNQTRRPGLDDDYIKAESDVIFTIKQAVLTIVANGSIKRFGEQDPYSNVWNNTTTITNASQMGYLGGYEIHGFRDNDDISENIIEGTLRRNYGEEVGVYDICNYRGNPKSIVSNCAQNLNANPFQYSNYNFNSYGHYGADGSSSTSALVIKINSDVYGSNIGRTLNTNTRNYAILFIKNDLVIQPVSLIVQPGVNQGKEYSHTAYNDPLWQLVVYGERIEENGGVWSTAIEEYEGEGFTGYTDTIVIENNREVATRTIDPYDHDTEIYYTRRKTSPNINYEYVIYIDLNNYTQSKYSIDNGFYKSNNAGTYIYEYGSYYEIVSVNRYSYNAASHEYSQNNSGQYLKIIIKGRLVNQTYSLFDSNFEVSRATGESVGWYNYDEIKNFKVSEGSITSYTIRSVNNAANQCSYNMGTNDYTIGTGAINDKCRNYKVIYRDNAPEPVVNEVNIEKYVTTEGDEASLYKPNGVDACNDSNIYSKACTVTNRISFEIFKREIILEFIEYKYTFIYGERYDYYDGGSYDGGSYMPYGNSSGIMNVKNDTSEGDIFLCYSDLGNYLVDCTTDRDYGLTENDTWQNVGLSFKLHSVVSEEDSGYYDTSTDKAVPAGTYFVYASITDENYKFTYLGGTLTIKPKVTSVELTGYTKEYREEKYSSYGLGTDFSEYTSYKLTQCMDDSSYYTTNNSLIDDCSVTSNTIGNTYGFVIEGLDDKDDIAQNFIGRPTRAGNINDDVGTYKINEGTIATTKDTRVGANFIECASSGTNCVFKTDDENAINYDITHSLDNNEGAYLFITPATITITVTPGQTKMYGCAYYTFNESVNSYYAGYTYQSGYATNNCNGTSGDDAYKLDLAYKYKVNGDKDVGNVEYEVSTNNDGTRSIVSGGVDLANISLTDTRLYRVIKNGAVNYTGEKAVYQGQKVGVYTITLGSLDTKTTASGSKCDKYNNPVLEGSEESCRNYNINYYGNSASKDVSSHEYTEDKEVNLSELALYTLKYETDANGKYVYINGKYIHESSLQKYDSNGTSNNAGSYVYINNYANNLQKYRKLVDYEEINNGSCDVNCYIKLDGNYVLLSSEASNRYDDANGTNQVNNGAYLKIGDKYIKVDSIAKFKKNETLVNGELYVADNSGEYVYINNQFVRWNGLEKYAQVTSDGVITYTPGVGDYILIYGLVEFTGLTRYKLVADTASNTYYNDGTDVNKNIYVFINGSYIPYNSLIEIEGQTMISVNSANLKDGENVILTRGAATTDTDFTITARRVYVHTEYNTKPYGDEDPIEYITCGEIKSAYIDSDNLITGREYCVGEGISDNTQIELGVSMYYAVQNSLAKAPWTAWTDIGTQASTKEYSDIQFDVLKGQISRRMQESPGQNDIVGKYTFDFAGVTNVDTINGENYMIVYVTNETTNNYNVGAQYEDTYVRTGVNSYSKLKDKIYEVCVDGTEYCANGQKIKNNEFKLNIDVNGYVVDEGGTSTSISLIQKYSAANDTSLISYWYLGFYAVDTNRSNEITKWWSTREDFSTKYDTLKGDSEIANKFFTDSPKEVYFEIVRRTIYLYAVDTEKIYGEADKYSDFLVAICGNEEGYIKDNEGKIKCKSNSNSLSYGLSEKDKSRFINADDSMNSNLIRGITASDNYIFQGAKDDEDYFGIYFRRSNGEDAGYYKVTACAAQSDITDCTDPDQVEEVNTPIVYLGDNYRIIEISGILEIKTREISITPDTGQGFKYGNYTGDGEIPNITFTEAHNGENGLVYGSGVYLFNGTTQIAKINKTVNNNEYKFSVSGISYRIDGLSVINETTNNVVGKIRVEADANVNTKTMSIGENNYTIIQQARCLINISGIYTICINDAQNEKVANALSDNYYEYGVTYEVELSTAKVFNHSTEITIGDVEKQYYNYNVYEDEYSNPARYSIRSESDTPRNALDRSCTTTGLRYSRDVCDYIITAGELGTNRDRVSKQTSVYTEIINARRYEDAEGDTQNNNGAYLKVGNSYYQITTTNIYILDSDGIYTAINSLDSIEGIKYLRIDISNHNYRIVTIDETKIYSITAAGLKVTPEALQYKIYGEKDSEIKFTVETEYVVEETHYQLYTSNIVKMCNVIPTTTCYTGGVAIGAYRYSEKAGNNKSQAGNYILLTRGWIITLASYAYAEENSEDGAKANKLDYGKNYLPNKVLIAETISQDTSNNVTHFDKYTTYKSSWLTTRILLGNLYVTDHNQNVGERIIVSGLKVGINNLGNINYSLTVDETQKFTIIPRPVNVEIENVTKTYGQATDRESCDGIYESSCIVGDGILIDSGSGVNQDDNDSLLDNNYNILGHEVTAATIKGISVTYGSAINMPSVSSSVTDGTYLTTVAGYYTASGTQERKNATLNIKVVREKGESDKGYNISKNSSECLVDVSGETFCEDVGEYFLKFTTRDGTMTAEGTINDAYYQKYWGYNPNYYIIIYNNFENSGWAEGEFTGREITSNNALYYGAIINQGTREYTGSYTDNDTPQPSATIKIRKRPIEITVETISTYNYTQDNAGSYLKVGEVYHLISPTNLYERVEGTPPTFVHNSSGEYLCTYSATNSDTNCHQIIVSDRYNRISSQVASKYTIEQNMDVPALPTLTNDRGIHHTTYLVESDGEETGYITWYEQPRQVRTGDVLYGNVAYCQTSSYVGDAPVLDTIRNGDNECNATNLRYYYGAMNPNNRASPSTLFDTSGNGYYIITRDKAATGEAGLYIKNGAINDIGYENNNYSTTFRNGILQIDIDETPPIIKVGKEFIIKEANGGIQSLIGDGTELAFLEGSTLVNNYCENLTATRTGNELNLCKNGADTILFTYEDNTRNAGITPQINHSSIEILLEWFGLSSYDPSVMRAGVAIGKRYDARWYIVIQSDFDQKKVDDYTIFIYAQDNVGNISLASTATLRIVDNTAPTSGTLNLYNAEVKCKTGFDCSKEASWVVKTETYLPINTLTDAQIKALARNNASNQADLSSEEVTYLNSLRYTYNGTNYVSNQYFGEYYRIPVDTIIEVVKHRGWTNAKDGIWLTVTGGDDNSLTYLDTAAYADRYKLTVSGDDIVSFSKGNVSATDHNHLLLGSLIDVNNMTKYRKVQLKSKVIGGSVYDESDDSPTVTIYLPDKEGTIIRYKGYYYDLVAGNYEGASPSIDDYMLRLYKKSNGTESYALTTTSVGLQEGEELYIYDGEFYEIPIIKYSKDSTEYVQNVSGTYVNFAQWDNYYSRDRGKSWVKHNRDTQTGYLALGQDGQRLIMIKAIDNGYTFNETNNISKTDVDTENNKTIYCLKIATTQTCATWQQVSIVTTANNIEYIGEKVENYNISQWEIYTDAGNRDIKYAYLDTIAPHAYITNDTIGIYEYGCSDADKCSSNYAETFGKAIDGYLFELNKLIKYNVSGVATLDGGYVKYRGEVIEIVDSRKFNISCSEGNCTIAQNNEGEYIYLGKTDVAVAIDDLITNKVGSRLTTMYNDNNSLSIYDQNTEEKESVSVQATDTSETLENLLINTRRLESGLGKGESLFDGKGNESIGFGGENLSDVDTKYTPVYVYTSIRGGLESDIIGHTYYDKKGYYKFSIGRSDSTYTVQRCFSSSVPFGDGDWCASPTTGGTYDSMKEAIDALLQTYKSTDGGYNFQGNDITFNIDFKVSDIAGNMSRYMRKEIYASSFTRPIMINVNEVAQQSFEMEIEENAIISPSLLKFSVVTANGKALDFNERIVQTVYYNGELINDKANYDLSYLSSLDTKVPGVYRIVYNSMKRDGSTYVEGNKVELTITVVPHVAEASNGHRYLNWFIPLTCLLAISVVGYVMIIKRKKKII